VVGGRGPRHLAIDRDECYRALALEQVVASLARRVDDLAEGALQTVDDRGKAPGIYEIEVSLELEIAGRSLQPFELVRHENIVPNRRSLSIEFTRKSSHRAPQPSNNGPSLPPLPSPSSVPLTLTLSPEGERENWGGDQSRALSTRVMSIQRSNLWAALWIVPTTDNPCFVYRARPARLSFAMLATIVR